MLCSHRAPTVPRKQNPGGHCTQGGWSWRQGDTEGSVAWLPRPQSPSGEGGGSHAPVHMQDILILGFIFGEIGWLKWRVSICCNKTRERSFRATGSEHCPLLLWVMGMLFHCLPSVSLSSAVHYRDICQPSEVQAPFPVLPYCRCFLSGLTDDSCIVSINSPWISGFEQHLLSIWRLVCMLSIRASLLETRAGSRGLGSSLSLDVPPASNRSWMRNTEEGEKGALQ